MSLHAVFITFLLPSTSTWTHIFCTVYARFLYPVTGYTKSLPKTETVTVSFKVLVNVLWSCNPLRYLSKIPLWADLWTESGVIWMFLALRLYQFCILSVITVKIAQLWLSQYYCNLWSEIMATVLPWLPSSQCTIYAQTAQLFYCGIIWNTQESSFSRS